MTNKQQFNNILIPALAIAATVFVVTYGGRTVENLIEPTVENAERKAKRKKAEKEKAEIKQDTILVTGKVKNGKKVKPYYVNLNTVASQLNSFYKKDNFFFSYDKEVENILMGLYPYMMPRVAELYRIKYGRALIDDLLSVLTSKGKTKMSVYLNKL
jgi:hypothetical protein